MTPIYLSFFMHANLQYAELPASATPRIVAESYRPACELFLSRPWARAVFEFSGVTLELLAADYPDVIDAVRELVRRGQIELCASTYANPILPLIPLDHGRRQIAAFRAIYERLFGDLGVAPAGFYPQEFALDPSGVALAREAGYSWAPVMLNHYLESLAGRMNIVPDLPMRAAGRGPQAPVADLLRPFTILGAGGATLSGVLNLPRMIDLLFELSNGQADLDEVVAHVSTLHAGHAEGAPPFVFLGPSDMEFVGLDLRAYIADWRWPHPVDPAVLGALLDRLRTLSFVRFATAREYLEAHPPAGAPLYLKCGSDHPLLTPWAADPDNQRLNDLCAEGAALLRLAEAMRPRAGAPPTVEAMLASAWQALMLAENSDGRGWGPIPERRLFCYDQALRAIALGQKVLEDLRSA